jgi:histidinol-phosphatase
MTQVGRTKFDQELQFARSICLESGPIALKYFGGDLKVHWKEDQTPVTLADMQVEEFIVKAIRQQYPDDDILGEESSHIKGSEYFSCASQNGRRWIIDPIDGTYNFARNIPVFATLLALEVDGQIEVGIINAPAQSEMYWAAKGNGAFKDGSPIHGSAVSKLDQSQFNFGAPKRILDSGYWSVLRDIVAKTYRQRGLGDYISMCHVLEGKAEASLEVGVKPWDLAPFKILAQEAGCVFSDLHGGESIYNGDCLITNSALHEQFLSFFQR